ncbi:MAG: helicase C-terminal domain-containing protein, partial [Natronomonas sp.]
QVLCKAPYPNTNDSRVAQRLEDGQWGWYYRTALRTVIQACGRVVRAPDDHGATYLADSSLLDLFERARHDMPEWFEAQVDRMTRPDLPAFDPASALGEASEADSSPSQPRSKSKSTSNARRSGSIDDHPLSDVWGDG